MVTIVKIASFSRFPAGRYRSDGKASGEAFREEILAPALEKGNVELILDGVAGLPSSFLEEITGGLVRAGHRLLDLEAKLKIISKDQRMLGYRDLAWRYIKEAAIKSQN